MAETSAFHRSRVFYLLSAILIVFTVTGFFIWRNFKYKLVNKKLNTLVTVKSKGLYQINYKNLIIDEALGNMSAENVEILPDTLVYQSLRDEKKQPDNLFLIRIPKLIITGVKTPKALLNKEISAHIIRIENADILIRSFAENKNKGSELSEYIDSKMYRQLLGKLRSITADSIIVEHAGFTLLDKSKAVRCKASGVSFRFAGTVIDSTEQNDSLRILFSKQLSVHCDQVDLPDKNKKYSFLLNGLDFNFQSGNFHLSHLKLKPLLSETAFARSNKFSEDRFDIETGDFDVRHIKLQSLLHQELAADTIRISDAFLRIFRDKSYPHDSVDRTHAYPQEAIMFLPVKVYIKNILIKDSYIEYKEKNDKSDSSGKVAFFHVQAKLGNVTNIHGYIRKNNQMVLNFKSSFLNESPFTANIRMRLDDRNGNFNVDAQLGELNASSLNPLLKPMALAEVGKGNINGLHFYLNATNTHGRGKLIFLYNHLSVKLLKKDDRKNKYKTKLLPTIAAGLLIKESNPLNGKTRLGNVDYTRDIHRSIFNMMWKSLFSGIKQVAM